MDSFPPAEDGPRYELQSLRRTLDDLSPIKRANHRHVVRVLLLVGAGLLALMAFVGWLLVGPPLGSG